MKRKSLLSLMLLCFAFFGVARAEVVEIGSGTTGNSYLPTYSFYNYSLTQQIYPACEIGTAGTINSIAFHNVGTSAKTRTLDVYFVLTDKSSFSGATDWITVTASDLVYSGSVTFPASDWVTLTLNTPFTLDGTNNLAVIVDDNTGSYSSGLSCATFDASGMAIRVYSDGTNYNPLAPTSYTGTVMNVKNCIQLDITPDPSVTLCCPPDAITVPTEGITAHEAVVNWEGGAAPYTVEYKKTTDTEWTVGATGVTELTTTLTGLTQNTTYQARVQSGCGSAWVTSTNFTTLVSVVAPTDLTCTGTTTNSATLSWTENGAATSWVVAYKAAGEENFTEVTVNENPCTITGLTHSTAYTAKVCAVVNGENSSWSSTTTFNTECEAITTFPWSEDFESYAAGNFAAPCWVNEHISGDGTQIFKVYTSTTAGNSTHQLQLPDMSIGTLTKLVLPEMTLPENYEFSIDVYRSTSTYNDNYPDEGIRVYASTNGEIEGATELAFIPRHYQVSNDVIPAEAAAGWYTYELPLGMSGTCYIILRGESQYCTATYMDNFIVKEAPACMKPTGLAVSDVYGHGATFAWTSDAAAWQVQLGEETPIDVTEPTYTFTGLDPETEYSVKVRSNCDGIYSDWTDPVSFTTTVACPAPTALTVTLTSGNGSVATLSWTENGTATEWDVEYGLDATFEEFRVVNVEGTPTTTLEGLTPELTYFARVKTYCGGEDGYSTYSNVVTFTPTDAFSLTVNDGTNTNAYVPVYGLWVDSYSKSQFIIPAADLADMANSIIKKITFHSSNANVAWGAAQFEVYVAEVENTSFESAELFDWTRMTKVKNAGALSIVDNKMVVELTSPYQYMGGNLMVGILETTVGSYSSCSWYGVNQETNTAIGGYESSKALAVYQFLPKTTFTYEEMPNCFATNLTIEPAAESAALTWTSENGNFDIWYRELVLGPDTDFENGIGVWTTIDADGDGFTWESHINTGSGNFNTHSGDGCMVSASYDSNSSSALTPDNYLVSPRVELGGSITFWASAQDAAWPSEHFGVAVSTTGNTDAADFTTIQEWTMTAKGTAKGSLRMASRSGNRDSGEYYEYTVDLSDYAGEFGYVAIRHFDCTDWFYLDVDDITIVQPNGVVVPDWTEATSATNSYTITGLTPETQYEVQVRANCGDDEYSEWMYDTFTTLPLCEAPTSASVETGTDYITLSWVSEAEAFDIMLDDEIIETAYEGYTYTFENLDPGTTYVVAVRTNCGETGTSDWVGGSIMTDCEAFDLPYEYNFDDMLTSNTPDADCWTTYSFNAENEVGFYYQDDEHTGIMVGFGSTYPIQDGEDYGQILISPELNTEAPVTVSFDYRPNRYDEENHIESFAVGYMTSMEEFDVEFVDFVDATNPDEFTTYTTTLPAGTKYVVVYYTGENPYTENGGYYSYLFVDNFVFEEGVEGQTIELTAGWNWVSTYIDLNEVDGITMIEEALGDYGLTISLQDDYAEYVGDGLWLGLEGYALTNAEMVMIEVSEDCTITLAGPTVDPSTVEITLNPGMTWIGFPVDSELELANVLVDPEPEFGDGIMGSNGGVEFLGEWMGDFDVLTPGQGYMYWNETDEVKTLTFLAGGEKARREVRKPVNLRAVSPVVIKRVEK